MIEPNRLAHCLLRTRYHEVSTFPECARCRRIKSRIPDSHFIVQPATLLAWGNRPFCEKCHAQFMRKHQLDNRREPFLKRGEGVIKHTIIKGDPTSRPSPFVPVTILYELRVHNQLVDSSAMRANRATSFIAGSSGPCLHVQLLSCHRLDEGSIFDRPDVYCVVWWKNRKIYTTAERENTSDPVWDNETAVVPLHDEYYPIERAALRGAVMSIPHDHLLLRIQVYDSNLFTRDEFLGESAITLAQLLHILAAPSCDPRVFPLRPKSASGRLFVAAARTVSLDTGARMCVVLLKVSAARDLASVDGSRPVRRPYVSCRVLGGDHLGETEKSTQADPDFGRRRNVFCLVLHAKTAHPSRPMPLTELAEKLKETVLHFEVRDAHRFGSAVLGELKLGETELVELLRASDETTRIAKAKGRLKKAFDRTLLTTCSARMTPKLAAVLFADAQDFALQLSDEHNGRKRVKGTLGMRFIYHTRGTVLRGIDVGVRQMCLGERAKLTLRPDYGFDAARPGPDIPAHAELEAIVDLVQVGARSATRIFIVRAVQHRLALIRHFCARSWTHFVTKYPALACVLRPIVCCMGALLRYIAICLMLPIRLCTRLKRSSLKLARVLSSRRSMYALNSDDDDDDSDECTMPPGDIENDDSDDNAAETDEELLNTQFDLLDFEDAFSDEEVEALRRTKLQNAKRLFDGTSVDPRHITTGLDRAAAAAMLKMRLPPTEVDNARGGGNCDSRQESH